MEKRTGPRRQHAISAAVLAAALVALPITSGNVAAAPLAPEIDEAGVQLLDDALDALSDGDTATYDRLANDAYTGVVWLPFPAIMALQDREVEDILLWSFVLDAENVELLDEFGSEVIGSEQSAMALLGTAMTDDEFDDLIYFDVAGAGLLEVIDRRQISIPQSSRNVLAMVTDFENFTPDNAAYDQALADLDLRIDELSEAPSEPAEQLAEEPAAEPAPTTLETDVDTEPAAELEVTAEPGTGSELTPVDVDVATPDAVEEPAVAPAPAPADTNTSSSSSPVSSSQLPMILTGLVAGLALFVAFFAIRKGGRSEELADIAFTDSLTGLNNRRRLDADVAAQVAAGERSTAVLMVDVDHFKKFNDEHGHAMGDEVLRLVGEALSSTFRKKDVPYRYGGEEFCVILADTTRGEAIDAGERARRAIEEIELPIPSKITASVGVSTGPSIALTGTIERADAALYDAKKAGRNRVADGDATNPPAEPTQD